MAKLEKNGKAPSLSIGKAWIARLERSQHIFLVGLIIAFAVEILVDWNATFYEIKVLRAAQREKANHFTAVLRLAAEEPAANRDKERLSALARRVLEDEDVAFVRFTDAAGAVMAEEGEPLGARFPHQLERDVRYLLADPDDLRKKIAASRHRDVFQAITDAEDQLIASILPGGGSPPKLLASERALAYQDRLYDEATRDEDRSVTWSLGLIEAPAASGGPARGVTLVALRTDRMQAATQKKLLKGAAITLFFLGVIFVQQIGARRAKLHLLSLRDALAAARTALRAALPDKPPTIEGLDGALVFEQAERLGGTVYDFAKVAGRPRAFDVFVALPEGSGVDVALASVYVRDEQRRLREEGWSGDPEGLFTALAQAYARAPIHRRLIVSIFTVDLDRGEVSGVCCGGGLPVVFDSNSREVSLNTEPFSFPADTDTDTDTDTGAGADTDTGTDTGAGTGTEATKRPTPPDPTALLEAPLLRFRAPFPDGSALLFYNDGLPTSAKHPLDAAEIRSHGQANGGKDARATVDELRALTLKRAPELSDDLFVLLLRRTGSSASS